jgi:hypothetical protein
MQSFRRMLQMVMVGLTAVFLTLQAWITRLHLDLDTTIVPGNMIRISTSTVDERIIHRLQDAGVNVTTLSKKTLQALPTWESMTKLVGTQSQIVGLETCQTFRNLVPTGEKRYLGVAGMFNSGTNLLAYLLEGNCEFDAGGGEPLWQVPWGKHGRASTRDVHTAPDHERYNKTLVLPVVVARNPYDVMESMCRNSYTVVYPESNTSVCPYLVDAEDNLLPVAVGRKQPRMRYHSIAHYWNAWYQEYLEFPHPRLVVRLEDLTVRPKETIQAICHCAGGTMAATFSYVVKNPKEGMGHGAASETNGMVEAWARLGKPVAFGEGDYQAAKQHLDPDLMQTLGYQHPPRQESARE